MDCHHQDPPSPRPDPHSTKTPTSLVPWVPHTTGIPAPQPCWTPALNRIHTESGSPSLRPFWAPDQHGTTRSTPHLDPRLLGHPGSMHNQDTLPLAAPDPSPQPETTPHQDPCPSSPPTLQALPGPSSMWNNQSDSTLGSPTLGPQTARIPAPQVNPGLSSTGFPDYWSTRLPLGPPLDGSKCVKETQTGLDAKGQTEQLRLPEILLFQSW
jgi:hypothetical protein